MTGQFDIHNLYYFSIGNNILVTIFSTYAITATMILLLTDLTIWYCQFAYLNNIYLKQLLDIISSIKIFIGTKDYSTYIVCIQAKITRQTY